MNNYCYPTQCHYIPYKMYICCKKAICHKLHLPFSVLIQTNSNPNSCL